MPEMFTWTSPGGEVEILLPYRGAISSGLLRRIRRLDAVDAMYTLMEEVLDADTLAATDALTLAEVNQLWQDWQEATLPESSGSSS